MSEVRDPKDDVIEVLDRECNNNNELNELLDLPNNKNNHHRSTINNFSFLSMLHNPEIIVKSSTIAR